MDVRNVIVLLKKNTFHSLKITNVTLKVKGKHSFASSYYFTGQIKVHKQCKVAVTFMCLFNNYIHFKTFDALKSYFIQFS